MSQKILHGEGLPFTVVWDWYQPQMACFRLMHNDKPLLTLGEDIRPQTRQELFAVCDLLNASAPVDRTIEG